jgi:hypothetical protein
MDYFYSACAILQRVNLLAGLEVTAVFMLMILFFRDVTLCNA